MCGIFGVAAAVSDIQRRPSVYRDLVADLLQSSETRGGEASGVAVKSGDIVSVYKSALAASAMLRDPGFLNFLDASVRPKAGTDAVRWAAIGHCRLVTNGREADDTNNQPVVVDRLVGVHNGIVVNQEAMWRAMPGAARRSELDSEAIFAFVADAVKKSASLENATASAFALIEGEASVAFLDGERDALILATNTGSLYWARHRESGTVVFASERAILAAVLRRRFREASSGFEPRHLGPGQGLVISLLSSEERTFDLASPSTGGTTARRECRVVDGRRDAPALRRCSRCILPETFPMIDFDASGVCNYCRDGEVARPEGRAALERLVARHRRRDGRPDCIVALSGGRDSCYGLHVIKKELGLNPIAFTYDWGLVTDIARRNQSRVCGKLGVEHIWRTADIAAKRRYVRANLEAWMARPRLGMIPLFTAGDKEFYYHARHLRAELDIDLVFFCAGNAYEETRFKTGFAGVREAPHRNAMTRISVANKLQLAAYYAGQVAINPRYVNRSLPDAIWAFLQTYLIRDDFLYLFHYMPWDEASVVDTLRREYDWELASDTETTWRIGDATAAFYNYVYHSVAGFSEHDTFRSNQVRAGALAREDALRLAERDNKPRYDAIDEYAKLVGVSANELYRTVHAMPKLTIRRDLS